MPHTRARSLARSCWRQSFVFAPSAVLLLGISIPEAAGAVTYVGTRSIGPGTIDLSIQTDGKTGALAAADIVAWTVVLHDPSSAFPLRTLTNDGANGSIKSLLEYIGGGVEAIATELSFTFTSTTGDLMFYSPNSARPYYGAFGDGGYPYGSYEGFDTGLDYYTSHFQYTSRAGAGRVIIATAAAVPEPAAWALMVVGFGLVGAVRRAGATVTA